jgi:hypothetical protein
MLELVTAEVNQFGGLAVRGAEGTKVGLTPRAAGREATEIQFP